MLKQDHDDKREGRKQAEEMDKRGPLKEATYILSRSCILQLVHTLRKSETPFIP